MTTHLRVSTVCWSNSSLHTSRHDAVTGATSGSLLGVVGCPRGEDVGVRPVHPAVPVAIAKFAQDFEILYTQMAASAALSILPALVLLLIGQRYIVKGLTQGAVK